MVRTSTLFICLSLLFFLTNCGNDDSDDESQGGKSGKGGEGGDSDALEPMDTSGSGSETDSGQDSGEEQETKDDGIDRSHLSDLGMTDPLDYSDTALWVCHPDHESDFCHDNGDATEMLKDGSRQLVKHEMAEDPEFDCFYVYPTVLTSGEPQWVDFSNISIVFDPILSQAVPFTRICRMYAPLYRQIGLNSLGQVVAGSDELLAAKDVFDAFNYYIDHHNQGRNFVLVGHSQGTFMLTAMIQQLMDDDPDMREHLISAVLAGGGVTVPEGELVGGTFKHIPICSAQGETGCIIHYVTFGKDSPPGENARFGIAEEEGQQVACTSPSELAGNTGRLKGSYIRSSVLNSSFAADQPIPEGIDTPFLVYRDVFRAQCVKDGPSGYLEIQVDMDEDDQREVPPYRSSLLDRLGFGLHLVDHNLQTEDLLDVVTQQAAAMP